MSDTFDLTGRVAIVTGGNGGIGRGMAMALAQAGASVVVVGRNEAKTAEAVAEMEGLGAKAIGVRADVGQRADASRMMEEALRAFGRIDILVNNAGAAAAMPFEQATDQDWASDLDLKFYAAVRFVRLVAPHMRKAGGGRVINVTNLGGKAPGPASVPTSVSRAAGLALTKALSKDLAKDNILVTSVCIGAIKSAQNERRYQQLSAKDPALTLHAFYQQLARSRNVPLGRVGESAEAGDVIAFLASERASYLTGVAINIDGGASPVL
ncbi:MAG: SDR family NAD(P)-dependent oxidoreductase [Chloroflexota bacterium]|nr:SDR family NAD(P)-dependent oxidoreductase [Chloroflexota bacterium]